jgi:hypothetical protein
VVSPVEPRAELTSPSDRYERVNELLATLDVPLADGSLDWLVDAWDIVADRSRYRLPAEKLRKAMER